MSAHAALRDNPDLAACGVDLHPDTAPPHRSAARTPEDITCDVCALRVVRALQHEHPDVPVAVFIALNRWPSACVPGSLRASPHH